MHVRLLDLLREISDCFEAQSLPAAVIGGLAVNLHGYARSTLDLDFLIDETDVPRMTALMAGLGFEPIDQRADLASYVRGDSRIDFLHARRDTSRRLLQTAAPVRLHDIPLRLISIEGLLAFKIQAYNDDPRRLRDLSDMLELLKRHRTSINMDEVRGYFGIFGREELLDELLRSIDPA